MFSENKNEIAPFSNKVIVKAEVNVKGVWLPVTIVDKESEYLYKVHFAGKDNSEDEWIPLSQIRNFDSSVVVPPAAKEEIKMTSAVNCSFNVPVLPNKNAEPFSEKVGKRKVYEYLLTKYKTASNRIGISFLYFQDGQRYTNIVSVSANKELVFKNADAPAGALIYPVVVKYRLCEDNSGTIATKIIDGKFACYRNIKGIWECSEQAGK